ncbi:MAG: ROK family transcriptional regulator [Sphingomicrobium sp.]
MAMIDVTHNRLALLKAIRNGGPIARTELQEFTGLASATITQVTSELLKRGLIVERKEIAKRNGRPRILLDIDPDGGIVVGASLTSRRRLIITFVDLTGEVRFKMDTGSTDAHTHEELADRVAQALETAIGESGFTRDEILRVGLSLPALVDSVHGTFYFMSTFPLGPYPLAERIANKLGLPVTIENEMNCIARFEHWFGRARHLDTLTVIDVGHAIGAAEYRSGLPKCGAHGITSQLGHMKLHAGPKGRPCYCGARGCANAYASIFGILQQAGRVSSTVPPIEDLDQAFQNLLAEAAGSNQASALIENAGWHLGLLVANHINVADPGDVLILVSDDRFTTLIRKSFDQAIRDNALPGLLNFTNVRFELFSSDGPAKGTAALALEQSYLDGAAFRRSALRPT